MNDKEYAGSTKGPVDHGQKKKIWIWSVIVFLLLIVAVIILLITLPGRKTENTNIDSVQKQQTVEPKFIKEGELFFLRKENTGKPLRIDIEIADDEVSRSHGLMFRRSMADTVGMLFIFENSEPRSFWMENTFIPLDIIFVNGELEITGISKNAVPFSEAAIKSDGNAKYVVEVNAGFSDNNRLKAGDKIKFDRQ